MPGPEIGVKFGVDTSGLQRGMEQAQNVVKSKVGGVGTVMAGVFGGNLLTKAAGAAKDFFSGAVKGALDAEDANVRFAQTLRNVTGASDAQITSAGKFITSMSKQGAMAKSELRPAFETLLRGTKNVTQAQSALKIAMDVSAGSGKPLSAVSLAMTKAFMGNVSGLQRLGIQTKTLVPNTAKLTAAQAKQTAAMKAYLIAVHDHGAKSEQAVKANDKLVIASKNVAAAHNATKKVTLSTNAVMKELAATFGGQASKQADTMSGRIKNAQLQYKAMQVSIGQALLPVLGQLAQIMQATVIPAMTAIANLAKTNPALFKAMAVAVVALVLALKFYVAVQNEGAIATKVWAAAQWLFNAAMDANPIMLAVIAIAALIAIVVIAYTKVGWFRAMIDAAWQGIQTAFRAILAAGQAVFGWIAKNWPLLLAIITGPIGIATLLIIRNWTTIKNAATAVVGWIVARFQSLVGFFGTIVGAIAGFIGSLVNVIRLPIAAATAVVQWVIGKFNSLVSFFTGLPGRISGAVGSLVNVIKGPVNAVVRGLNALEFTIPRVELPMPGHPGFGPFHIDLIPFNIPQLARGGVTTSEGLAWLHPAEVITPMAGRNAMGPTEVHISVVVPPTANPTATGRAIVDAIRSYETIAGTSWRMAPTGRTV